MIPRSTERGFWVIGLTLRWRCVEKGSRAAEVWLQTSNSRVIVHAWRHRLLLHSRFHMLLL